MTEFFDQSFWQQLVSNAIAGLLTGLLVGFIIWFTQRKIEARQEKRKVLREIAIAWERVLDATQQPDTLIITSALKSSPLAAVAIGEALEKVPINYWNETLPDSKELKLMVEVGKSYRKFKTQAMQLDDKIYSIVRQFNAERDSIDANDAPIRSYFIGKVNNFSDAQLAPHLGSGGTEVYPWVIAGFDRLKSSQQVLKEIKGYQVARKRLLKSIQKIKSMA